MQALGQLSIPLVCLQGSLSKRAVLPIAYQADEGAGHVSICTKGNASSICSSSHRNHSLSRGRYSAEWRPQISRHSHPLRFLSTLVATVRTANGSLDLTSVSAFWSRRRAYNVCREMGLSEQNQSVQRPGRCADDGSCKAFKLFFGFGPDLL